MFCPFHFALLPVMKPYFRVSSPDQSPAGLTLFLSRFVRLLTIRKPESSKLAFSNSKWARYFSNSVLSSWMVSSEHFCSSIDPTDFPTLSSTASNSDWILFFLCIFSSKVLNSCCSLVLKPVLDTSVLWHHKLYVLHPSYPCPTIHQDPVPVIW